MPGSSHLSQTPSVPWQEPPGQPLPTEMLQPGEVGLPPFPQAISATNATTPNIHFIGTLPKARW